MKRILFIIFSISFVAIGVAYASALPGQSGGTGIATTTVSNVGNCLSVSSVNPLTYTFGTCAGGSGGGGSSTLVYAGNAILVNASGSNGYVIVNNGVTSTAGNWAGSWQLYVPSDFVPSSTALYYLATNPSNYISSSTGNTIYLIKASNLSDLTSTSSARTNIGYTGGLKITISSTGTISLTTSSISQFANDSGYLTSISGALLIANNLSDLGSTSSARTNIGYTGGLKITISSTGTISVSTTSISQWNNDSGYLTSLSGALLAANNLSDLNSTSTARTNIGFTATSPITLSGLGAFGCATCIATNTGNWVGTWANATSGTYYPASNPSGFITTSTNNFGGITTSTYNASITIATAAPLGGGGQLSNNGTLSLTCTGCLTSAGSGSVSTSSAITRYYFPYWSSSTGQLAGTSSIFFSSSTSNVGIGDINPGSNAWLSIKGSNTNRVSIEAQNTNSGGNASFYFQNDRGSFATYGGLLTGGSADANGNIFGASRADKTFLISDGASSLGLGIGTLTNTALTLGTNNASRLVVDGTGIVSIAGALNASSTSIFQGQATFRGGAVDYNNNAFLTSTSITGGQTNYIPLWTSATTLGTSTLSQTAGTTLLSTVAIFDAAGDFIGPNIYLSGNSIISQNVTGTTIVGDLVQSGGVTTVNTTTTLSGNQFCVGGFFNIQGTTSSITITTPTTSTIASASCGANIWTSSFAQQFMYNNSTNTVYVAVNGSNEKQLFSPGTPTSLAPGQEYFIQGQFENSSTLQGATSTNTNLVVKYTLYQTSTPFYISGNSLTIPGTVSSTESSALILAAANGTWGAYGGASACAAGQAVTTISAVGGTTCAAFASGSWVATSSLGSYAQGSLAFYITSSTISASSSIKINSSTGDLSLQAVSSTNAVFSGYVNITSTLNVTGATSLQGTTVATFKATSATNLSSTVGITGAVTIGGGGFSQTGGINSIASTTVNGNLTSTQLFVTGSSTVGAMAVGTTTIPSSQIFGVYSGNNSSTISFGATTTKQFACLAVRPTNTSTYMVYISFQASATISMLLSTSTCAL